MSKLTEHNCPRCGEKGTLEVAPASTHADTAVQDFTCDKCGYAFGWRDGSAYPKPERAHEREYQAEIVRQQAEADALKAKEAAEAPPVDRLS